MKISKRFCIVLAVIMLATAFAGCAKGSDEDILATVEGTPVYRWLYNVHASSQLAAYQQYTGIDLTSAGYEDQYQEFKEARLEDLVQETALKNEAQRRGLYDLTDEEEAQLDQQYLDYYNESIAALMSQYGSSDDAARRKAEKAFEEFLAESSLNPERVRTIMLDDYVLQKLTAQLKESEQNEITEEQLRAEYETQLASQTESVAADPVAFGANVPNCPIVIPEGYVLTQRIRLGFTPEDQAKVDAAQTNVTAAVNDWVLTVQNNGENSAAATTKERAMVLATEAYDKVVAQACENIRAEAEEIYAQAKAGSGKDAFIKLGETCTDDYRMADIYVCAESTHVDSLFRDAALAMSEEGTISELVATGEGYCIIYLDEICTPGARSFEEVEDKLRNQMEVLQQAQSAKDWRAEYAQKAEDAGQIERHLDLL